VLAQFPEGRSRQQLSLLSGYSMRSSSFSNTIGNLRSRGYATPGWPTRITEAGLEVAGDWEPAPTGPELVAYWLNHLDRAGAAFLKALVDAYPDGVSREDLGARTGYSIASSSFSNTIGKLRSLELATKGWPTRASEVFFE
jgi:hypothetical protein